MLIGSKTSERKWIKYEIKRSWCLNKGLLGIYIHNLEDKYGNQTRKGKNPFDQFTFSNHVKAYDPPYINSKDVYKYISSNIAEWVEKAIEDRS